MDKNLQNYNLQPADRIVLPKKGFPLVKHHAIYLGTDEYGRQLFAENNSTNGVQIVQHNHVFDDINEINEIIKYKGNNIDRKKAVKYALSLKGTKYDLLKFNCEHYSELVQTGISKSSQLENVGKFLTVSVFIGVAYALLSDNKEK